MRKFAAVLLLAGLVLSTPVIAQQNGNGRSTIYAVKGILMMPGEAYVEEVDAYFDIDMSSASAAASTPSWASASGAGSISTWSTSARTTSPRCCSTAAWASRPPSAV